MKKNSSLKRSLAMGMAVAMVGATLAGCGGSSSAAASSTAESTAGSEAAAEPANAEKPYEGTTLTWYTKLNANVSDNYTNLGETPWAQYVEEKTGIHIEFQHPTQGSENEEFAVMVASGEYPDIIEHTWTSYSGGGGAAINDGVIIALDDYMDQAPNLSALLEENPEISKMIKSSSGNYYCFPFLRGLETPNKTEFSSGLTYRADVLKELGFDTVPETIDEWEEVLRAAKAAGFSKPFTTRNEWVKDVWSPAFDNWGSFYVDDGVVKNGLIEDSRKEFIARMAAWYDEGLLDNDWMQADKKSTQTDFVAGNCVLGYAPFGQGLGTYTQAMMEADPNFKEEYIQAAAPVTSTKGKNAKFSKMNNIFDQSGVSAAISSQCKNVEAAVWLLDWMYSEEGMICYNFGIEGVSYEMVDGKPVYTDVIMNNPDGMSVAQALAAYTRTSTSGVGVQMEDYIEQYYAQDNQKTALELSMKTDMGEHMFPPCSVSEENQDRYTEIMSQVKTLSDEMEASFICGTTSMDEWDSYQQKLKDAGIEEAIAMMQQAYDNYMAN
ncbi:extracellular solute-binding protein [bacterium]|nr:extracellular solute-binding protein [bacterium]MCI6885497.1 extracellular solute-binding protein [bacterium]